MSGQDSVYELELGSGSINLDLIIDQLFSND